MSVGGVILFPGAGGNSGHPLFVELERRTAIPVARVDFAYRIKAGTKRRPPDRMPKLLDDVHAAVAKYSHEWDVEPESLVLGGRSMGGRVCSIAAAEGLDIAGLLLFSYPLHPPKKPEKLRVDHFENITCPVLLVQGQKDPFGTPEEFDRHVPAISGPVTECWVAGNHDPRASHHAEMLEATDRWLAEVSDQRD